MREGYAVTVSKDGENILTIEHECLSGRELTEAEARVVWDAGEHLKAFAGDPDLTPTCFFCGSSGECSDDCNLTFKET